MGKENRYMMSTIDEYFDILDKQTEMNSKIIAKSLVKYLKASKESTKFDALRKENEKVQSC